MMNVSTPTWQIVLTLAVWIYFYSATFTRVDRELKLDESAGPAFARAFAIVPPVLPMKKLFPYVLARLCGLLLTSALIHVLLKRFLA